MQPQPPPHLPTRRRAKSRASHHATASSKMRPARRRHNANFLRCGADEHQHAGRADKRMDFKQLDHALPQRIFCLIVSGSLAASNTAQVLLFKNSRILIMPL
jgi:hypothetical protein